MSFLESMRNCKLDFQKFWNYRFLTEKDLGNISPIAYDNEPHFPLVQSIDVIRNFQLMFNLSDYSMEPKRSLFENI